MSAGDKLGAPGAAETGRATRIGGSPMQKYFEGLLILLLAAGFLTLAASGAISWTIVLAVAVAFLARFFLLVRGIHARISRSWMVTLILLYVPFYALDMYALSPGFVGATLHLVLFAAVVKMFTASQASDYGYLCALAFLEVLAAATLSTGGMFFACFLAFAALMVATFTAFEVYRAQESAVTVAPASARRPLSASGARPLTRSLARFSLLLTGGVMVFTLLIFLLLPRASMDAWSSQAQDSALTGFNDRIDLGAVARLQKTDQTVMHVRVVAQPARLPPETLSGTLLRGRVLENFDGRLWSAYDFDRVIPTSGGRIDFNVSDWNQPPRLLRYAVTLEPLGSPVLFFPARLIEAATRFPALSVDFTNRTLSMSRFAADLGRGFSGTAYTGISDLSQPPPAMLRDAAPTASRQVRRDLQLPLQIDPRIPALARQLTSGLPDNWDKMQALAGYLRDNYRYTLDDLPGGPDPLADFLFQRRAGYCEYFASALAIMARTVGIPTRLVNGFELGEYNPISGEFIVRGRDAHSWVEAYFAAPGGDSGTWVSFDATPPAGAAAGATSQAGLLLDALSSTFQEWVVDYDWLRQASLAAELQWGFGRHLVNAMNRLKAALNAVPNRLRAGYRAAGLRLRRTQGEWFLAPLIPLALLAAILLRRRWMLRRTRRHAAETWTAQRAAGAYRRFQRLLRRAGYARAPAQTAEELVQQLEPEALRLSARHFIAGYQQLRFGLAGDVTTDISARFAALHLSLRQVKRTLAARKPAR